MELSSSLRLKNWSRNGAIFGLVVALLDMTGWRGSLYAPWSDPNGPIMNALQMLGSIIGGAFMFLLAAFIVNLATKD